MALVDPIKVDGLRDFSRDLRKISADAPKQLRLVGNEAADLVVTKARPKIPRRSGRAARSVRKASTRTAVRVRGGGGKVPYYPWLDYGGKAGPYKRIERPFVKAGRYLYPSYYAVRDQVEAKLVDGLRQVARSTGWEVS